MAGELDGPRLEPPSGTGQAPRRVPARLRRRRQRPDRHRPGLAGPAAGHRVRVAARARAMRPGAGGRAVVSAVHPRAERALGGRQQGRPGAGAVPRRRTRPPQAAAVGAGAGRLQPGHHDGAARRASAAPSPPAAIVGYSGIFVLPDKAKPDAVAGEIKRKPPVLLIHGAQDDLIPAQALFQGAQDAGRARSAGRMAHLGGRRPRHRPGGPAPRRRVPGPPIRAAGLSARRRAPRPDSRTARPLRALHNAVTRPCTLCLEPPLRRAAFGGVGGTSP